MELYAESTLAAKEVGGHRWISAYLDHTDSRSCGTVKPKTLEGMGFPEANKTWKLLLYWWYCYSEQEIFVERSKLGRTGSTRTSSCLASPPAFVKQLPHVSSITTFHYPRQLELRLFNSCI